MVDLVVLPLLVAGDLPVGLLEQQVQRADLLGFAEVRLVYVDLGAQDPEGQTKQSRHTTTELFTKICLLVFRNPLVEPFVETLVVNVVLVVLDIFDVTPLNDFRRI